MTTKRRLITDSFKVVKKARRHVKQEKRPPSPPQNEDTHTETQREKELLKLKQFDQEWIYGPCTSISRLQRWERAQLHGLDPPQEIRELLIHTNNDPQFAQSLWNDYPL